MKGRRLESRTTRKKVFKPAHEEPGPFFLDYILLPYGEFYDKTKDMVSAKRGDTLRFFNGPEYEIDSVSLIPQDKQCDILCRMRYNVAFSKVFEIWRRYALLEGYGKDILSTEVCIFMVYKRRYGV